MGVLRNSLAVIALGISVGTAPGQIDSTKRELIQLGYNQPLEGHAPLSAYAFYYLNLPEFLRTNFTLRLTVAPVYLDSELGIRQALGPYTDVGLGLAGGGFADSYYQFLRGKYWPEQSFIGYGGGGSANLYQRFNPHRAIPLSGIFRAEVHSSFYARDSRTAHTFTLPPDHATVAFRTGLRYGGQEPLISPDLAMELSAWEETLVRTETGLYGFNDRRLEQYSHLFWGRALFAYTLPEYKHRFALNLTLGGSVDADRLSAYRLGGILPLAAEFPLSLPGYFFQEFSARRFALIGGNYSLPLDHRHLWTLNAVAATAAVDYLHDLSQDDPWLSGVGGGFGYRSPAGTWQILLGYAYGINAIRSGGVGAHSVGFQLQFDLERAHTPLFDPGDHPIRSRGLQQLFHLK
jgi:hypothetical protein